MFVIALVFQPLEIGQRIKDKIQELNEMLGKLYVLVEDGPEIDIIYLEPSLFIILHPLIGMDSVK